MPDRTITFKGSMIRAILAGEKTETRRMLRMPEGATDVRRYGWGRDTGATVGFDNGTVERLPFWAGDRVAVREAVRAEVGPDEATAHVRYLADEALVPIEDSSEAGGRWYSLLHYRKEPRDLLRGLGHDVPPMHAPLWTSRLTLVVEDIRIENLHEITDEGAIAEGVTGRPSVNSRGGYRCLYGVDGQVSHTHARPRHAFRDLWDQINGNTPRRWSNNPFVIVISFRPERQNIATLPWCPRATAARLTPAAIRALQTRDGQGQYSTATFDLLRSLDLVDAQFGWTPKAHAVREQLKLTGRY